MLSSSGAVPAALTAARARLADANMFMRYDYAWKGTEFGRAETRMAGVACRVLYLHAVWRALAGSNVKAEATPSEDNGDAPRTRAKVLVDANGYAPFHDEVARACALMDCDIVDATTQPDGQLRAQVQLAFVYVSPHGEERVEDQYATFKAVTGYHSEHATPADARPLFCFLLGEAAFLDPPATDEVERLRGLSGFAISQRFSPLLGDASYTSVAHFAVEYTPLVESTRPDSMSDLMNRFGCMDHNVMEHVEKWEMYAFQESVFHQNAELTTASDYEVRYWLEHTHGKACDSCHAWREKLLQCSRCGSACYCSRDCQKSAWKLHKQLCGKTAAEISAAQDADVSATQSSK